MRSVAPLLLGAPLVGCVPAPSCELDQIGADACPTGTAPVCETSRTYTDVSHQSSYEAEVDTIRLVEDSQTFFCEAIAPCPEGWAPRISEECFFTIEHRSW